MKRLLAIFSIICICLSCNVAVFAYEGVTKESGNEFDIMLLSDYEHVYETGYMSDNIGYYDYKLKIHFNKNAAGKFTDCVGYIYTDMNTLAVSNSNYVITCSISDATHSISSDGTKITIKFNMNYQYSPAIFGDGWTEQKTFILHDYDV